MKRKEVTENTRPGLQSSSAIVQRAGNPTLVQCHVSEIDPAHLVDPVVDGKLAKVYVGQGSFSLV